MKHARNQEVVFERFSQVDSKSTRWCVYAHYDKRNQIQEYVYHALAKIRDSGFSICFVSTNESFGSDVVSRLASLVSIVIRRENLGYDFGSYKAGLTYLTSQDLLNNSLLLTNDSLYGPFITLDKVLSESYKYDLFGLTDSYDTAYHIQSYFLLYSKNLVRSDAFQLFWKSVSDDFEIKANDWRSKRELIIENEIGGSQFFLEHGFKLGVAFSYSQLFQLSCSSYVKYLENIREKPSGTPQPFTIGTNSTHTYWQSLLEMGYPYLKKELLLRNPLSLDISAWELLVSDRYQYDLYLILDSVPLLELPPDLLYCDYRNSVPLCLEEDKCVITSPIKSVFVEWAIQKKLPLEHVYVFDESFYLNTYQDVKRAVANNFFSSGWHHYRTYGFHEAREFQFK